MRRRGGPAAGAAEPVGGSAIHFAVSPSPSVHPTHRGSGRLPTPRPPAGSPPLRGLQAARALWSVLDTLPAPSSRPLHAAGPQPCAGLFPPSDHLTVYPNSYGGTRRCETWTPQPREAPRRRFLGLRRARRAGRVLLCWSRVLDPSLPQASHCEFFPRAGTRPLPRVASLTLTSTCEARPRETAAQRGHTLATAPHHVPSPFGRIAWEVQIGGYESSHGDVQYRDSSQYCCDNRG